MNDYSDCKTSLRDRATRAITTIEQLYPNSKTAKICNGDNDFDFEKLLQIWVNALSTVSNAQLESGIQKLLNSGEQFEPSIPAFIKLCKGNAWNAYNRGQPQLEHQVDPKAPASIKHLPKHLRDELIRIDLIPLKGETTHAYAERCQASTYGRRIEEQIQRNRISANKADYRNLQREGNERDYF